MYQDLSEFKCKPLPPPFPGFVMVCLKIGYKNDQLLHALKISSCRANRWKRRKKPMDKPMDNGSVSFIEYPWNDDFWGIGGMHFPTHPYIATWIQKSHKNSGGTHRCPKIFRQSRSTSLHVYSICFFYICFYMFWSSWWWWWVFSMVKTYAMPTGMMAAWPEEPASVQENGAPKQPYGWRPSRLRWQCQQRSSWNPRKSRYSLYLIYLQNGGFNDV